MHGLVSLVDNKGSAVGFIHEASELLGLNQDDGPTVFSAIEENQSEDLNLLFKNYCHEIAVLVLNLQSFFRLEKVVIGEMCIRDRSRTMIFCTSFKVEMSVIITLSFYVTHGLFLMQSLYHKFMDLAPRFIRETVSPLLIFPCLLYTSHFGAKG